MHSAIKFGLLGCGALVLLVIAVLVGGFIWLASGPESGVKLSNQMDEYALRYLDEHDMLEPGETVLAYYDVTIAMDGSEATLVTDRRVIYHRLGATTSFPLTEVEDIAHRYEGLAGDVFSIRSEKGEFMQIEIAPWNGGETFKGVLLSAWERARGAGDEVEPQLDSPASGMP